MVGVRRQVLVVLAANLFATNTIAQTDFFDLSPEDLGRVTVTVTASGYQQSVADAAASVTIIHESEWRAMGSRTLFDVLGTIPGIHISNSQLVFASDTVVFRGLRNDNNAGIKLLQDGQPIEFLFSGGFVYTFDKPLSGLKRIEVVRGSGSALYGADAFAGVINLITKDEQDSNQLTLRGSVDDSFDLGLNYSRTFSDVNFIASLEYQRSDDDPERRIASDSQTSLDQKFGSNASLAPGVLDNHYEMLDSHFKLKSEQWFIDWWGWRNFDAGAGPGVAQALDPDPEIRFSVDLFTAGYKISDLPLNGQLDLVVGYQQHDQSMLLNLFPAGTVLPMGSNGNVSFSDPVIETKFTDGLIGKPKMETERSYFKATHLLRLSGHTVRAEVGYEDQKMFTEEAKNFANGVLDGTQSVVDGTLIDVTGTSYIYIPDSHRYFYHVAVQDDWVINDNWSLNMGVRQDHYSDFGVTTNPRLGLVWQAGSDTTVKVLYGSAFRAPAFQDQFNQNNPVAAGNPDINPEEIDTYEVDINHNFSHNLSVSAALFSYRAEDLISFVFDPVIAGSQAENQDRLKGEGFELSMLWTPQDSLRLFAQHSFVDTELNGGGAAPDVPKNNSFLAVNWRITDRMDFNVQLTRVADRERAAGDPREDIDDYTTTRMKLAYNVGVELAVIGENVFDEDASEPSTSVIPGDYPLPGRRIWLEATLEF